MDLLRCDGYDIALQEVPDEISLAINITECPHHCVGCHSGYLAGEYGEYVKDILPIALERYASLITCVCFMGGDQHMDDLIDQCGWVKEHYPHLKLAMYTGADDLDDVDQCLDLLDYVKIGHYDENLGGLDSPTTNQVMYHIIDGSVFENITYRFRRKVFD